MKQHFDKALEKVKNVDDVREAVIHLLKDTRETSGRVGFVSGIIFSDGEEHKARNLRRLGGYVEKLRKQYDFPIFSGLDIFYSGLFEKLPEGSLPFAQRRPIFFKFWKDIVECGYITDLFMTPRWKESQGSIDERDNAKRLGITIHYVDIDETIAHL